MDFQGYQRPGLLKLNKHEIQIYFSFCQKAINDYGLNNLPYEDRALTELGAKNEFDFLKFQLKDLTVDKYYLLAKWWHSFLINQKHANQNKKDLSKGQIFLWLQHIFRGYSPHFPQNLFVRKSYVIYICFILSYKFQKANLKN